MHFLLIILFIQVCQALKWQANEIDCNVHPNITEDKDVSCCGFPKIYSEDTQKKASKRVWEYEETYTKKFGGKNMDHKLFSCVYQEWRSKDL